MTELENIRKEIEDIVSQLNEDSSSRWEDERYLHFGGIKPSGDKLTLELGVGKHDTYWTKIILYTDGWRIKKEDKMPGNILVTIEQVVHNLILPILPNERIEAAL